MDFRAFRESANPMDQARREFEDKLDNDAKGFEPVGDKSGENFLAPKNYQDKPRKPLSLKGNVLRVQRKSGRNLQSIIDDKQKKLEKAREFTKREDVSPGIRSYINKKIEANHQDFSYLDNIIPNVKDIFKDKGTSNMQQISDQRTSEMKKMQKLLGIGGNKSFDGLEEGIDSLVQYENPIHGILKMYASNQIASNKKSNSDYEDFQNGIISDPFKFIETMIGSNYSLYSKTDEDSAKLYEEISELFEDNKEYTVRDLLEKITEYRFSPSEHNTKPRSDGAFFGAVRKFQDDGRYQKLFDLVNDVTSNKSGNTKTPDDYVSRMFQTIEDSYKSLWNKIHDLGEGDLLEVGDTTQNMSRSDGGELGGDRIVQDYLPQLAKATKDLSPRHRVKIYKALQNLEDSYIDNVAENYGYDYDEEYGFDDDADFDSISKMMHKLIDVIPGDEKNEFEDGNFNGLLTNFKSLSKRKHDNFNLYTTDYSDGAHTKPWQLIDLYSQKNDVPVNPPIRDIEWGPYMSEQLLKKFFGMPDETEPGKALPEANEDGTAATRLNSIFEGDRVSSGALIHILDKFTSFSNLSPIQALSTSNLPKLLEFSKKITALDARSTWKNIVMPEIQEGEVVTNWPMPDSGQGYGDNTDLDENVRARIYKKIGFGDPSDTGFQYGVKRGNKVEPLNDFLDNTRNGVYDDNTGYYAFLNDDLDERLSAMYHNYRHKLEDNEIPYDDNGRRGEIFEGLSRRLMKGSDAFKNFSDSERSVLFDDYIPNDWTTRPYDRWEDGNFNEYRAKRLDDLFIALQRGMNRENMLEGLKSVYDDESHWEDEEDFPEWNKETKKYDSDFDMDELVSQWQDVRQGLIDRLSGVFKNLEHESLLDFRDDFVEEYGEVKLDEDSTINQEFKRLAMEVWKNRKRRVLPGGSK